MALRVRHEDPSLDEAPRLALREARKAVCYPDPGSPLCDKVLEELVEAGVNYYVSYGPRELAGLRALGRGWAGNVFLAELKGRLVVVKALSPKSRRRSMLWEACVLAVASHLGVAPTLVYGGRRVLVYEYVRGVALKDYLPPDEVKARALVRLILWKARLLDAARIRHNELARPEGQIIVSEAGEPYVVDYDSATIAKNPSNVTQVYGGLLRIAWARQVLRPVEHEEVREALKEYKNSNTLESWERLVKVVFK